MPPSSRQFCTRSNVLAWNGARPPLGYRIVAAEQRGAKVKKKLQIDPLQADKVRLICPSHSMAQMGLGLLRRRSNARAAEQVPLKVSRPRPRKPARTPATATEAIASGNARGMARCRDLAPASKSRRAAHAFPQRRFPEMHRPGRSAQAAASRSPRPRDKYPMEYRRASRRMRLLVGNALTIMVYHHINISLGFGFGG